MKKSTLVLYALGILTLASGCFIPVDGPSNPTGVWSAPGSFSTLYVLGNKFHTANVNNTASQPCRLFAKVDFTAPTSAYYRFRAKIIMEDGSWIMSPVFSNASSGARTYRFNSDTTGNSCWGGRSQRIRSMRVAGCRGYGCTPNTP